MGFSKLKIPRVCEFCENPFEAKTVTTRFCCKAWYMAAFFRQVKIGVLTLTLEKKQ